MASFKLRAKLSLSCGSNHRKEETEILALLTHPCECDNFLNHSYFQWENDAIMPKSKIKCDGVLRRRRTCEWVIGSHIGFLCFHSYSIFICRQREQKNYCNFMVFLSPYIHIFLYFPRQSESVMTLLGVHVCTCVIKRANCIIAHQPWNNANYFFINLFLLVEYLFSILSSPWHDFVEMSVKCRYIELKLNRQARKMI